MRTNTIRSNATLNKFRMPADDVHAKEDWWKDFVENDLDENSDNDLSAYSTEEFLQRADDSRYLGPDMTMNGRRQDLMEMSDLAQDFLEQWANDMVRDASERQTSRH